MLMITSSPTEDSGSRASCARWGGWPRRHLFAGLAAAVSIGLPSLAAAQEAPSAPVAAIAVVPAPRAVAPAATAGAGASGPDSSGPAPAAPEPVRRRAGEPEGDGLASGSADPSRPPDGAAPTGESTDGLASFYARRFNGRRTASGEVYDPKAMTMAHRSLPFGTWVSVTNLGNGRSVRVRVNDRGPWTGSRLADLSMAAARQLGFLAQGVARVRLERLPDPPGAP